MGRQSISETNRNGTPLLEALQRIYTPFSSQLPVPPPRPKYFPYPLGEDHSWKTTQSMLFSSDDGVKLRGQPTELKSNQLNCEAGCFSALWFLSENFLLCLHTFCQLDQLGWVYGVDFTAAIPNLDLIYPPKCYQTAVLLLQWKFYNAF